MFQNLLPRKLLRHSGLFAVFGSIGIQVVILVINVVTSTITARFLGPNGRGSFVAITLWPQLMAFIALSGIQNALIVLLKTQPLDTKRLVLGVFLIVIPIDVILMIVAYFATGIYFRQYDGFTRFSAVIFLPMIFCNSIQMIMKQVFAGLDEFGSFNLCNLLPQLFYLLLLLPILLLYRTPFAAALSLFAGGILSLLLIAPSFIRALKKSAISAEMPLKWAVSKLISFGFKSSGVDLVNTITSYLDRLILIPLISAEQLGLYAVGYALSRVIFVLQPAINVVVFSKMSERTKYDAKLLHDRTLRATCFLVTIFCCFMPLFDSTIINILFGPKFDDAAKIFRILCFEASISCIAQVPIGLFMAQGKPGFVSIVQALYLGICLISVSSLAIYSGAEGAALGLLASAICRLAILFFGIKSALRLPLPGLIFTREDISHFKGLIRL